MPRGQPDFGLYTQTPVASGISDPGEAVARLGSINIYDRRGWTVWMDDFEAPDWKWNVGSIVPGLNPLLVTTQKWMGVQSAYLDCPAGAAPISTMEKYLPLIRQGKFGVEFWVSGKILTPGHFSLELSIFDGTDHITAALAIDTEANTVSIWSAGAYHVIDRNSFQPDRPSLFIPVKLVLDVDTNKYVRLLVGATEYDITAYAMTFIAATADKYILSYFRLYGDNVGDMYIWLDNFIYTQNEP